MTSSTAVFLSVASFVLDNANAQYSSTRWSTGIPQIKPLKEWLRKMVTSSWAHRNPSFYKMNSIVSALDSSIVNHTCVIQGLNGKFVFANGGDSAFMNLESIYTSNFENHPQVWHSLSFGKFCHMINPIVGQDK
ncbi:hypothetical protein B0H13DRAFT_1897712 [Mycena leptocephala]|nr:hypothetical protein B0H13DRAFT_1897712 [Mycena leptocephala]